MWAFLLDFDKRRLYSLMNPPMKVSQLAEKVRHVGSTITSSTYRKWKQSIDPIADLPVPKVTQDVVWDYVDSQRLYLAEGTVKARLGYLCGIWNRGLKRNLVKYNYWHRSGSDLKSSKSKHPYREWEFYKKYHEDPLFLLLWFHGFRVAEIAGIKQEDVCMDETIPYFNLINYEAPFRRLKNDASIRQVPIHPACQRMVRDLAFPLSIDRWGPGKSWSETFKKRLQLPDREGAHSLRHNFATRLRSLNPNPAAEARILGHTFPNMTARYGTVLPSLLFETLCLIPDPR